ncbi:Chromosomal replication initiator protein DnaA [Roseovarius albus]|uniref:Chromosomal replication initiator protein DnaA n=1 Tax=Roseovarius albus TaxID=1247867 RepID=A0A1X6ZHH2_9RHOB|nr:DnaA/Hda family protein [Roseovarius albus]SLN51628.1 Chromosomal replication initiator protein DnaA [Roseovarius albus]
MAEQLSFDLPVRQALGREDFFVAPSNATAVAMIEGWYDWPARKLCLVGDPGSGKTHLTHVWAALSGAKIVRARSLVKENIPVLASGSVAVEDVCSIAGNLEIEEALFHLHNLTLAEGHSVLFTARKAPSRWSLALPDLASRMQGTPTITLGPPDDTLLSAVLMKHLSDRQLMPSPETIPYLARRIDRSFDAARQVIAQLDAYALQTGRPITRNMAAKLLDEGN